MKKMIYALSAAMIATMSAGLTAEAAQRVDARYIPVSQVGPAVAGSQSQTTLPKKAQKFLEKIGEGVVSVEREYSTGEYDVTLSSGMEIDFNKHGNVIEIDAPGDAVIGSDIVKEAVPHRLYSELKDRKIENSVTSIESTKDGYKLEFAGVMDEALFNRQGDLIAMYYE